MASEIRVNKIENRSGLGTVTFADTGVDLAGIVTATTFSGSGASLTGLPAAQLSGALPAISAASLTNVPAANVVGVHTSLTVTNATTTGTAVVGGGVTISESGIEASGIGITCANINRGQIGGRRNIIINGAAMVAQRGDTLSGATSGGYATDRFQAVQNESGTITISQDSDAPTGSGFRKSHRLTQTTAQGSLAANDLTTFRYNAEGYDLQGFKKGTSGAEEFTVSFWVKSVDQSSYPVTYILELRDPVNTRSCCKAYTVSASDTWEYKTITFPADSSGQWATDNSKSLEMNWFVCAGSNYTSGTLSTTWAATVTANRAAGLTANLSANTANRFFLTGVQLEVGSQATAFEHRSVGEELALCQRYFYRHGDLTGTRSYALMGVGMIGHNGSTDAGKIQISAPVRMRTQPTATVIGTTSFIVSTGGGGEGTSDMVCTSAPALWTAASSDINFWVDFNRDSGGSPDQGIACIVHANNNGANIGFDAEL